MKETLGLFREVSQLEVSTSLKVQYQQAVERVLTDLDKKGLLGKHPLHAVPVLQSTNEAGLLGRMQGNLFGFSGYLYGEQTSEPSLTFAWLTNTLEPLMVISGIPSSKVVIKQQEAQPSIEFRFNLPHFVQLLRYVNLSHENAIYTLEYDHPNHYLKPEAIHFAVIEVDQNSFSQLQSLQFGQQFKQLPEA